MDERLTPVVLPVKRTVALLVQGGEGPSLPGDAPQYVHLTLI